MKIPLCFFSVIYGALLLLIFSACGNPNAVSVATDNGFVPFEFVDESTGKLVGFDIDLIQAVAEEAGLELNINAMEFDGIIAGIRSGRHDIGIAGITITEARDAVIDFSDPYYNAGLLLTVSSENRTITSEADLAGKKVGTRTGSTSETYLRENHPEADVEAFPGIIEAYMDLEAGRLDAVLYDAPNVRYYVHKDKATDLKTVGDILQGEQYGIAFPEGSPLVAKVNTALATLKANGTYDRIHAKWFGEDAEAAGD